MVVFGSFKTQQQLFASPFLPTFSPRISNYSTALFGQGIGHALLNSVVVTVTSVVLTLVIASLAAYAVARIPGWKGNLIFGFLILGMAIPAQANMIPQRVLFESLGLLDSLLGLVLINITVTLPVATFILGGFMKTLPAVAVRSLIDRRRRALAGIPCPSPFRCRRPRSPPPRSSCS